MLTQKVITEKILLQYEQIQLLEKVIFLKF